MLSILSVKGVSKRFGHSEVLCGLDFELPPDSITVLLGSNGAGKTTLLRSILGLVAPDRGTIGVLGLDPVREATAVRRAVGYVPDQSDAYGWMTARDLFRFLRGQYPSWSEERAERLLECLHAPDRKRFDAMSRGEAAKVMLVAALAPAPALLVLDEPFARLAPPTREEVLKVFVEEAPFPGGAALVATHDLDVAARIGDRVLILEQGRLNGEHELEGLVAASAGARSLPQCLRALYATDTQEALTR